MSEEKNNGKIYLVVARHGERWDYVQRDAGINGLPQQIALGIHL